MNIETLSGRIHSTKFDITIDTCSTLEDGFEEFIRKNKGWIKSNGMRITVQRAVVMELARLVGRKDTSKIAMRAIALLKKNEDMFDIDIVPMTEEEIENAFADPEILNRINTGRLHKPQVLITNDHNLNGDAQNLNDLKSCHGKQVFVVELDSDGGMKTNWSLKKKVPAASEPKENTNTRNNTADTVAPEQPEVTTDVKAEPSETESSNVWKHICRTTGLVLLGAVVDHYGPTAFKACRKLIKAVIAAA